MSSVKDIVMENEDLTSVPVHQIHHTPRSCACAGGLCLVSPHPDLRNALIEKFQKEGKGFKSFYEWAREHHHQPVCPTTRIQAEELANMRQLPVSTGLARVAIPQHKISGDVYLKVLLVSFPDQKPKAQSTKKHFEELLFSEGVLPNGSLREYFWEVTQRKVTIKGYVSDWLMMPQPKSYYTDNNYATGNRFPNNSQGLAADAIKAALANGIEFPPELDFKKNGTVGAFYIFATGRGAEQTGERSDIWSHKTSLRTPIEVNDGMSVSRFLFVPEDAQIGVCAHELGHLAFEWDDFYDVNKNQDGSEWDGSGKWDLMAAGSWNGAKVSGDLPAPPASLHRSQHKWLDTTTIGRTTMGLVIPPQDKKQAKAVIVISKAFRQTQSLILENRSKSIGTKYDQGLPGGGLLVWKVDTAQLQTKPQNAGMRLVEADELNNLGTAGDRNNGDAGDPFPGTTKKTSVSDTGDQINTSFSTRSGITLNNIRLDPATQNITLDIVFASGMEIM